MARPPLDEPGFGAELYAALDRDTLPDTAVLASLGSDNLTAVADLHEGETVLDLGSGGGIDVLLSAIIKATRPADTTAGGPTAIRRELPVVQQSGCC